MLLGAPGAVERAVYVGGGLEGAFDVDPAVDGTDGLECLGHAVAKVSFMRCQGSRSWGVEGLVRGALRISFLGYGASRAYLK
jgi:hypothetical protein